MNTENQLLRISKTVVSYYAQLSPKELTQEDFMQWIESLADPMKTKFQSDGLEKCRGVLNFQRFVLEFNDFGLQEYLKENLNSEDFIYWDLHK